MLHIQPPALRTMEAHAVKTFPNECCGFFFGTDSENDERVVTFAAPVPNSKAGDQRRRFEIAPADYLWAERYAVEKGLTLLGIYHSHPQHPAVPSERDRAVALPWFSYIIVSVIDDQVARLRSWKLRDETRQFEEEALKVPGAVEEKPAVVTGACHPTERIPSDH